MTDHETPPATSSRAVARYDGPRTTADLQSYAMLLAVNTMPDGSTRRNDALPAIFRGNPAAVAFAVEYAKALDVSPVTALIGIHIVDGKPTASAGLISALVRRAGHKIRTRLEGSIAEGNAKAVTTIHRADDPEFEYRSEWTLDRAVRAHLMKRTDDGRVVASKANSAWDTYPENMLKARSVTECARDAAEDAILGVHYTPEELGADVDETGDVVYTVTQVPPTPGDAPIPPEKPDEKREEPSTEVDVAQLAADAREGILRARDLDDLTEVWKGPSILADTNRAAMLVTADENGEETTVLELFRRAARAINAGTPLVPDPDDGSPAQTGEGDPSGDGDQGEDVVEGELVDERGDGENDTPAPGTEEAKGSQPATSSPSTSNRDDLRAVWRELSETNVPALDDLKAYATRVGYDPANLTEEQAGNLLEAVADGSALQDVTIRETLHETPLELVTRVLGAKVITHERVTDTAELHRRELEERRDLERQEDRREAADVGRPGTGHPDREAAKRAAREGIARAKSDRK